MCTESVVNTPNLQKFFDLGRKKEMEKISLMDALKASYDEEISKMPTQHSQRTVDCPPMPMYIQYAKDGWPEELKAHATACIYCQKSLAAIWSATDHHPSEEEINDPSHENRIAIERHVNWHCVSCQAKVRN